MQGANRIPDIHRWWQTPRKWLSRTGPESRPKIGLALGGGFARGIAHVGALKVLVENGIPIDYISGVSAGAIVAAAYAAGATPAEIAQIGRSMRFRDVARWTINRLGLAGSDRMAVFLERSLKASNFEDLKIPLAIVATDLATGRPVVFRERGELVTPIRASCSFPGLFLPIRHQNRYLVDGFVGMEVPAQPLREMGATHVISVFLPNPETSVDPDSIFSVLTRCFQIMTHRLEHEWRRHSSVIITPECASIPWDSFSSADELIRLGECAGLQALPKIQRWLTAPGSDQQAASGPAPLLEAGRIPA